MGEFHARRGKISARPPFTALGPSLQTVLETAAPPLISPPSLILLNPRTLSFSAAPPLSLLFATQPETKEPNSKTKAPNHSPNAPRARATSSAPRPPPPPSPRPSAASRPATAGPLPRRRPAAPRAA